MTNQPNKSKHVPATIWTSHLRDPESKEKFLKSFYNTLDTPLVNRLIQILEHSLKESNDTYDYDSPNWAYRQAHMNGKTETLQYLLDLLKGKDR